MPPRKSAAGAAAAAAAAAQNSLLLDLHAAHPHAAAAYAAGLAAGAAGHPQATPTATSHDEEMHEEDVDKKQGVSGFISKIYKMVSDPSTQDIVSWNDRGDQFVVKNEHIFASQIMRTYFRHQNFSSFVRQLNFYGFHKRSSPSQLTSFYHPSFRKGHPELLSQIQRKTTASHAAHANARAPAAAAHPVDPSATDTGLRDLVTNLSNEVTELRQQNEDLFKIQQRILYIFSRYMRASQAGQVGAGASGGAVGGGNQGQIEGKRRNVNRPPDDLLSPQNNKRQRLLMEARPDSPPYGDHPAAAASSNNNNNEYRSGNTASRYDDHEGDNSVVDLNTDAYNATGPDALYGSHSLSDLNWVNDPVNAINDLIQAGGAPLQQALNSSNSLPLPIGRPSAMRGGNQSNFVMNRPNDQYGSFGGNDYQHANLHLMNPSMRGRTRSGMGGSTSGGNDSNFLDLGTQLAATNPKQLLELLDRMGASTDALPDPNNRGMISRGRSQAHDPMPTHAPTYQQQDSISGVFEDADGDTAAAAPIYTRSGGRGRGRRGRGSMQTTAPTTPARSAPSQPFVEEYVSPQQQAPASNVATPTPAPAARSGAHLSPLDDEETAFPPIKSTTQSPVLGAIPSSPVNPFTDAALLTSPFHANSQSSSFFNNDLRSPAPGDTLSLSRPLSSQTSAADPLPFSTLNSPAIGAANVANSPHIGDPLAPLTPNNLYL